ncbi:MAG: PDDEXK nuclease domain-containing protein [Opitutaceae bacterium]|jgi:predicted nuclease of restriction endonuclease-like (RecB) superfamily
MIKRIPKPSKATAALPADYAPLLADIKARVQAARIKAGLAANRELLAIYWDIGRLILDRQRKEGWGAKVIDRLSTDLQNEFPGQQGFSPRNLKYMRAFAEAWPETVMAQRPVAPFNPLRAEAGKVRQTAAQTQTTGTIVRQAGAPTGAMVAAIVQAPLAQLSWYHHLALIDKLTSPADRLWYAAKAVEHGWSRNVLVLQIEAGLHTRQGKAVTNFKATLPPTMSDLAQGITKDPYLFDFLALREDANERAVEEGLIGQVEKFLLELGAGFALVGRQVHLEVGDHDFYLDLLFYHLKLRCFVVIDLKAREFTPEAAGKMNFYLSAVDDRFRQEGDQPSIGLILCRSKNRVIAEYALRDLTKPIGVSGYVTKLVDSLPKSLKGAVPSVAELEKGLAGDKS